ncbi:hypothetical protein BKG91_05905 [Rodentibacter caecimuris]|uniref:Uncharacterized protein n=1 Tax=Rodentibacter caecimuris TaxID=1796644 RepID=A0A9X8VXN2_9PAST|nr:MULTISPECIES: hypothetical protein [Pasteurellaceae]AOF52761.1 hypothetical protein AC062_0666 [Pasteurellaceae bacterium NI1060]MCQ9123486.1 hypothetical protein [Rodentibacter heylii]MCX2960888.1 hypothetical protein [Rodentibacter heylii]OOF73139.1 hypothetical protein BKG90_01905 [Rodentibacter heylii]OOF74589.1 hypothetical protein BKG91_05905 [Rodentibacter heylii]
MNFKNHSYWAIQSVAKDESRLIKPIQAYFKTHNRTFTKCKSTLLESYLPFKYKHFYWNLNKEMKTFIAIIPNQDLARKWREEQYKNCAWLLEIHIYEKLNYDNEANYDDKVVSSMNKTQKFLNEIFDSIDFKCHLLDEYDDTNRNNRWYHSSDIN